MNIIPVSRIALKSKSLVSNAIRHCRAHPRPVTAFRAQLRIRFNLRKGVYTAKQGFLFFARPVSGTFQEFYGLCIRPNKNKYGWTIGYRIELDWADDKRGPFELVSSLNKEKALDRQRELAAKLGIQQLGFEE